jgi:hypothetical protein
MKKSCCVTMDTTEFSSTPPLTLCQAFSLLLPRMKGCLKEWFHFYLGCHLDFIPNTTYESKNMYFVFMWTDVIRCKGVCY